jgi:hypothetical protein
MIIPPFIKGRFGGILRRAYGKKRETLGEDDC